MKIWLKNQQGVTWLKMVVVMILTGSALPFLLTLIGFVSPPHLENEILLKAANLTSINMEELAAFKKENSDWADTIASYAGTENLKEEFSHITRITCHSNYTRNGLVVYEAVVSISHTHLADDYILI